MRQQEINFETLARRYGEILADHVLKEIEKAARLNAGLSRPATRRTFQFS